MAITMSSATVNTSLRDSLLSSEVDSSVTNGGEEANTQKTGGWFSGETETTGAALAGITSEFAKNVTNKIEEYKTNVNDKLAKLQGVESNVAFQGTAVQEALTNFVNSVRRVAVNYLSRLEAAEKEIINSVDAAYSKQDTELSSNMKSDAGTLSDNIVTVSN
jgi:uncharacterized protein YoxC